jgi:hypothetical protein
LANLCELATADSMVVLAFDHHAPTPIAVRANKAALVQGLQLA